jgi:hypothetical protein
MHACTLSAIHQIKQYLTHIYVHWLFSGNCAPGVQVSQTSDHQLLETFQSLNLRLYRAYNCTDSKVSRLLMAETLEEQYKREMRIRKNAGLPVSTGSVLSLSQTRLDDARPSAHTPFHTMELQWKSGI